MRALVFDGQLHLETALPLSQPQDGDTLLKIRRAGICNTDLELVAIAVSRIGVRQIFVSLGKIGEPVSVAIGIPIIKYIF